MKTNIVVVEQNKKPPANDQRATAIWQLMNIPTVMKHLRKPIVQMVIWHMRVLGITKIMIKQTLLGVRSLSDIAFKSMTEQPPEEIRIVRNTLVRLLADQLTLIGVMELEIIPDEKEVKEVVDYWQKIQQPERQATDEASKIKLNTETDPTGDKVEQNEPGKSEAGTSAPQVSNSSSNSVEQGPTVSIGGTLFNNS